MYSVPVKQKRAAGFVIFRMVSRTIEYLLLQASKGEHHWTPPKGHTELGENDRQTAFRETMEESGLDATQLHIYEDYKKEVKYMVKGKLKTVVYFVAELKNQDTQVKLSHEHIDFKWLPIDEACELAQYAEMQEVLRDCDTFIRKIKHL